MDWLEKLKDVEDRYEALSERMALPEVASDPDEYTKVSKAQAEMSDVVAAYRDWKKVQEDIASAKEVLAESDADMVELAEAEIAELQPRAEDIEAQMKMLLLPRDPNDAKGVVLEVRAGTGGDEATLFAAEIFRVYVRFAEAHRWKVEIISDSESEVGGYKEVIALISGKDVYSHLKFESGVHRVQRVPQTETQGRVHTSAVTVAAMPEVDDVAIEINPKDVRTDLFCSSGPGGQSVNTTYSAVRLTHIPTGLVVSCQDEKSQIKNKAKAMQVLRSRLYEIEQQKQHEELAAERKLMVKSGDRSEKIRTYNFPQNRVTDHRIGLTLHKLDIVMQGNIGELIDALRAHDQAERLQAELGDAA